MSEETSTALTVIDTTQPMNVATLRHQVNTIQHVMREVMKSDEHYGKIPGCGDKPTLLQPGAQKLALTFGFAASYEIEQADKPGGHREYNVRCKLTHRASGGFVGEGVGCASTMEGKFRFRTGPKQLTDKPVPQNYWNLRKSDPKAAQQLLGGPGFSTQKNDSGVWMIAQGGGEKVEHDNPADYYNTVLKMAKKRAYVDATLTATAASDIFTQDIEDDPGLFGGSAPAPQQQAPPAQQQQQTQHTQQQPATTPPANNTSNSAATSGTFKVVEVKVLKEGTSARGPWTRSGIVLDDGKTLETFDNGLADYASNAMADAAMVKVEWTVNTQYNTLNLKSITRVDENTQQQPASGGTIEAVILSVEDAKTVRLNGQVSQAWPIVTNQGRMGTFDAQIAEQARNYAGTGQLLNLSFSNVSGQRAIEAIAEVHMEGEEIFG